MQIDGTSEQIEAARQLVEEVTSEVCSMAVVYMFLRDLVMFMQKCIYILPYAGVFIVCRYTFEL